MQQTSQAHNHGKFVNNGTLVSNIGFITVHGLNEGHIGPLNNGKSGYFSINDDNNMSYRYIFSITFTEMDQFNTHNPIYCNGNKR